MKTIRKQAAKRRLFRKLDALRATLPNDEREILDGLVAEDEVEAHKMRAKVASKVNAKVNEATAHSMNLSKVAAKTPAKKAKVQQVTAHSMNLSKVAAKTPAKKAKVMEVTAHQAKPGENEVKKEFPIDTNIEESRTN